MNKIKTKGRKFMNYIQSEDKKEVHILLEEKSKIWEERDFLET